MNMTGPDSPAMQEALYDLRRFLSDEIAPLTVADSVSLLLENDPEIMATGIRLWVESQLLRQQSVSTANYFYHALKKIRVVGDLNLVSKDQLAKYLHYLSQYAISCTPPEERQVLASNLTQLEGANPSFDAPVNFFYLQSQNPNPPPTQSLAAPPLMPPRDLSNEASRGGGRRFDMLLERLEERTLGHNGSGYSLAPPPVFGNTLNPGFGGGAQNLPGVPLVNGALAARAYAMAAANAHNEAELEQYLQRLGQSSLQTSSQNIFMTLGQNLPDWAILSNPLAPAGGSSAALPARSDSLLEAMERMVSLASDPKERAKRFDEIVQTAILQFNEGWLGRAASMLDTAQGLITAKEVEASAGNLVRQKGHEKINYERLRSYVESPHQRPLLRKVLGFFPDLTPEGLLAKLRVEEVRNRRRLIMMLLEIHGTDARPAVFQALQETVTERSEKIWYFQRNLLHLMHLIPRENDVCSDEEINAIIPFTKLNYPSQVAREALSNLGIKNDRRAEKALVVCLKEYEETLLNIEKTPFQPAEIRLLLDRIILVLVRVATPVAKRAVVEHGLKPEPQLGDTLARLAELGNLDLSDDADLVERILYMLARELPNKLVSMFVKREEKDAVNLIKSLAGTPSPTVRRFFSAVAKKYANHSFGKAAAEALAGFGNSETEPTTAKAAAPKKDGETRTAPAAAPASAASSIHSSSETESLIPPAAAALSGDLAIFGLPALLQNLADSRLSGVLTLKNQTGEVIGTITLDEGKIRSSNAKRLRNVDAVYQLLQKPLAGTFQFVQLENLPAGEGAVAGEPLELIPVLLEGMRRYDELQASCAVVPDEATFKPLESEPIPHEEEQDQNLVKAVWDSAKAGATAAECENQLIIDSYRVRRLLSHWVERSALKLIIPEQRPA